MAKLLGLDPQGLADEMQARWNGKHRRWEFRESGGVSWSNRPQPQKDADAA